jgi:hypothetical protein
LRVLVFCLIDIAWSEISLTSLFGCLPFLLEFNYKYGEFFLSWEIHIVYCG